MVCLTFSRVILGNRSFKIAKIGLFYSLLEVFPLGTILTKLINNATGFCCLLHAFYSTYLLTKLSNPSFHAHGLLNSGWFFNRCDGYCCMTRYRRRPVVCRGRGGGFRAPMAWYWRCGPVAGHGWRILHPVTWNGRRLVRLRMVWSWRDRHYRRCA